MSRASTTHFAHPARPLTRRWVGAWWLLLLHLFVASPCAAEFGLGAVTLAFVDRAPGTTSCCADRNDYDGHDRHDGQRGSSSDDSGEHSGPDAHRSACGYCHSLHPTTLSLSLVDTVRSATPRARDTMTGEPADGHTRLPFRPPTHV